MVFINDVLIYSKSEAQHEKNLRIVLQNLRDHQLYAKFNKCNFYKDQIQYLCDVIYAQGITMEPDKIKAIMDWAYTLECG